MLVSCGLDITIQINQKTEPPILTITSPTTTTNPNNNPPVEEPHSEGLDFTLNDDGEGYSVIGVGSCTDTDIIIPSTWVGCICLCYLINKC